MHLYQSATARSRLIWSATPSRPGVYRPARVNGRRGGDAFRRSSNRRKSSLVRRSSNYRRRRRGIPSAVARGRGPPARVRAARHGAAVGPCARHRGSRGSRGDGAASTPACGALMRQRSRAAMAAALTLKASPPAPLPWRSDALG